MPHTWLVAPWRAVFERIACPSLLVTGEEALGAAVGADARTGVLAGVRDVPPRSDSHRT